MSLFNTQDKELQAAAVKAGIRTAEQTLSVGLGVGGIGTVVVGSFHNQVGNAFTINWTDLLGALLFLLITALLAGLKSYLSIASNGLPAQYQAAAVKAALPGAVDVTPPASDPAPVPAVTPLVTPLPVQVTVNPGVVPAQDPAASSLPGSVSQLTGLGGNLVTPPATPIITP